MHSLPIPICNSTIQSRVDGCLLPASQFVQQPLALLDMLVAARFAGGVWLLTCCPGMVWANGSTPYRSADCTHTHTETRDKHPLFQPVATSAHRSRLAEGTNGRGRARGSWGRSKEAASFTIAFFRLLQPCSACDLESCAPCHVKQA